MSITLGIIITTVIASLYAFNDPSLKYKLMFSPYRATQQGEWYRSFTHAFIHSDYMHLFFNMYVLYGFGQIEEIYGYLFEEKGWYYYVLLYLGGILFATLPSMLKHRDNDSYWSLGASGAVSAVLFSFIVILPTAGLHLFFIPIPIPAFIVGLGYLAYEYAMDKRSGGRIAHDAHFYGALFGIIFTLAIDYTLAEKFINQVTNYF